MKSKNKKKKKSKNKKIIGGTIKKSWQGTKLHFCPIKNIVHGRKPDYSIKTEFEGLLMLKKLSEIYNSKIFENSVPEIYIPLASSEFDKLENKNFSEYVYKYEITGKPHKKLGYYLHYIQEINHPSNIGSESIVDKDEKNILFFESLNNFIRLCHEYEVYHGDLENNFYFDYVNYRIIIIDPFNIDSLYVNSNKKERTSIGLPKKKENHIALKTLNPRSLNIEFLNNLEKKINSKKRRVN